MSYDDVAWEQSDDISDSWVEQFHDIGVKKAIGYFILRHDSGDKPRLSLIGKGSFNIILRMKYTHKSTDIRFSQPGAILFPEEKTTNEIAVMRYIADQTSIPVPFVLHSGTRDESPLKLSPFIMMSHIDHKTNMYAALNVSGCPVEKRGYLNPDIDEDDLRKLYAELAKALLKLAKPEFSLIGSLVQVDDYTWEVASRPLSMNMNELVRLGTLPRSKLPPLDATFKSTSSYMEALAQLNIQHLIHQRNNAIESADDCRRKYVARQLFYKLVKEKKLFNPCHEHGPFRLWSPIEFSYAPPWWLLIENPDQWHNGIEDWTRVFDRRLKTFLSAMRHCEDAEDVHGEPRLSDEMRKSWESGDFWVVYAVLHSFAFDAIYWLEIDKRYFRPTETDEASEAWRERIQLLDETQRDEMEHLVTKKLAEMDNRVLAWEPDEYTEEYRLMLTKKRQEEVLDPAPC
ncbi:phosphotransferase family protein [Aspergillus niger]|uniref:uncharacterized protein n=1 Tax=Aspergillus lacticoffeatus (strain CBS 101883) TaxID=1450533 RepID=UPI000D7F04AA|nr:uncharacterized protein BO96DRAFT_449638 [Aspergillus niger CBS 101883]PYH52715.1 hypothetical protein BO96DRAFT_449638 [Aspergillus niger CBS 101883]GJP95617.1 phosphotransferase family protein [Aspergillus niger]